MEPARDTSYPGGLGQPPAYPAYPRADRQERPPRPPLTKRMRRGHWIILDCVAGGFAAVLGAAALGGDLGVQHARALFIALFMALIFMPVALRRRAPVLAFSALVVLGVLMSGMRPAVPGVVFLAAAYTLYTLTVESRPRSGIAALALALTVLVGLTVAGGGSRHDGAGGEFIPIALANIIAWMTGYSVRQRRRYVVTMQEQAAGKAVTEERLRIARELHDVVAHSMSVIAVQAGYGQYVIDASPDGAREALGAIQATSRDALEEMRRMLGVLRQQDLPAGGLPGPPGLRPSDPAGSAAGRPDSGRPDSGPAGSGQPVAAPLAPAPGLAGLDRLISRTCGAGVRVSLTVSGRARPAPGGVDLSAYRIIQEALTNVVRHAGTGAVCTVGLCYTDADLVIEVLDDGGRQRGPGAQGPVIAGGGSGHGIIGMQERVNLCGGTFRAKPLPGTGFQVVATLPLPAVDATADRPARDSAPGGTGSADVALGTGMPSAAGVLAYAADRRLLDNRFAVRPGAKSGDRRG